MWRSRSSEQLFQSCGRLQQPGGVTDSQLKYTVLFLAFCGGAHRLRLFYSTVWRVWEFCWSVYTDYFSAFCGGAQNTQHQQLCLLSLRQLTDSKDCEHRTSDCLQTFCGGVTNIVHRNSSTDSERSVTAIDCEYCNTLQRHFSFDDTVISAFCGGAFAHSTSWTAQAAACLCERLRRTVTTTTTAGFLAFCGGALPLHTDWNPDLYSQLFWHCATFLQIDQDLFRVFTVIAGFSTLALSALLVTWLIYLRIAELPQISRVQQKLECSFSFVIGIVASFEFQIWLYFWTILFDLKEFASSALSFHSLRISVGSEPSTCVQNTCLTDRKPGPKSGHSRLSRALQYFLLGIVTFFMMQSRWSEGEGCDLPTKITEAPLTWEDAFVYQYGAKPRGTQPSVCFGTQRPPMDSVKKRSLKRAFKRAVRDGSSWYKGKCFTIRDFDPSASGFLNAQPSTPAPKRSQTPSAHDQMACNRHHQRSRYLRYMSWNGSGMSHHRLAEIALWCRNQCVDILVLTETRWQFTNEWMNDQWMFLHSGHPSQPGAGILLLVSKQLCQPCDLRWNDIVPGRLVHAQIRLPQRNFDVLAAYQHVFSTHKAKLQERDQWWKALDHCLSSMPKRHVLLLTGDFNCRLLATRGYVGCDGFKWGRHMQSGSPHPDEGQFSALVTAHQLVALNTWHPQYGPTFQGVNGCSRIDFSFTRLPLADGCAKDVKLLTHAPFLDVSHVGHIPMLGQLRKFWIPLKPIIKMQESQPHRRSMAVLLMRPIASPGSVSWRLLHKNLMIFFYRLIQHTRTVFLSCIGLPAKFLQSFSRHSLARPPMMTLVHWF